MRNLPISFHPPYFVYFTIFFCVSVFLHQSDPLVFSFLIQNPKGQGNNHKNSYHELHETPGGKTYSFFTTSTCSLNDLYFAKINKPFYTFTRNKMVTRATSKKAESASSPSKKTVAPSPKKTAAGKAKATTTKKETKVTTTKKETKVTTKKTTVAKATSPKKTTSKAKSAVSGGGVLLIEACKS